MKVFLSGLFLLLTISALGFILAFAPYHFYEESLFEGVETEYLNQKKVSKEYFYTKERSFKEPGDLAKKNDKYWKSFHFRDFVFSLPVHNPLYQVVPIIEIQEGGDKKDPILGVKIIDSKDRLLSTIYLGQRKNFVLNPYEQKVFQLPLFRKTILEKSKEQIWEDLFTVDLLARDKKQRTGILDEWPKLSYQDLVYRLYILQTRDDHFPQSFKSIAFFRPGKVGILELEGQKDGKLDSEFRHDEVLLFYQGHIFQLSAKFKNLDPLAEEFRSRFFHSLKVSPTREDSSEEIYAAYKSLPYQRRIDQEGMVYLFTAYSHVLGDRNYMEEMIRFLERGKNDKKFLRPLYEYAFNRYGTNFSGIDQYRLENASEKAKRMLREKKEQDYLEEKIRKISSEKETFESFEEKRDYYLQRAKDRNFDSDDSDDVLYVD